MSFSARVCRCKAQLGNVVLPRPVAAGRVGSLGVPARQASWTHSTPTLKPKDSHASRDVATFAWGDDIVFTDATVVANKPEANSLNIVTVNVGNSISEGYTKGGQFLQMKVGDSKPAFLAIANAPEASKDGLLEFLIKDLPESTAHKILGLGEGDKVSVSPVMGKGFPVDKVPPADFDTLLVFATGTGISPIKALLDAGALDVGDRKDVRIYYGATDADSMAYMSRIPAWEAAGAKVIKVFSARKEGYVQDVYAKDDPPADPARTCVLLCGQPDMAEAVKGIVIKQGISLDNCLTNF